MSISKVLAKGQSTKYNIIILLQRFMSSKDLITVTDSLAFKDKIAGVHLDYEKKGQSKILDLRLTDQHVL